MSSSIVPYNPDFSALKPAHASYQTDLFHKRRDGLVRELRCFSGIPEICHELSRDVLYKVVVPEGKLLQKANDGLFRGVFYKNGRVEKHAKFAEVKPGVFEAAKTIGAQILLVSIAMQLNRIEGLVRGIYREMHNDRLAEIKAGVNQFDKAMLFESESTRKQAVLNSVQTLHTGINKSINELKVRIASAPTPENSIFDHLAPWKNKIEEANESMTLAAESFNAILLGIGTLAQCYSVLGEYNAAKSTLYDYFMEVDECNIDMAADKARLLPFSGNQSPQEPWVIFQKSLPSLHQELIELPTQKNSLPEGDQIEIEFMVHEFEGGMDENLSRM